MSSDVQWAFWEHLSSSILVRSQQDFEDKTRIRIPGTVNALDYWRQRLLMLLSGISVCLHVPVGQPHKEKPRNTKGETACLECDLEAGLS